MALGMWLVVSLRYQATARERWTANTKDAFMGSVSPVADSFILALLGHPREISIPYPLNQSPIQKILGTLFFRRVRPVETRLYAFARNSFAMAAIATLIFRAATAFQQAQNEIRTRVTTSDCSLASKSHRISILLDRLIRDDRWPSPSIAPNVTISGVAGDWAREYQSGDSASGGQFQDGSECRVEWSQRFNGSVPGYPMDHQTRVLELYGCPMSFDTLSDMQEYSDVIEVPKSPNGSLADVSKLWEVVAYLPPMKLLRGSSIVGKANLITRRFITSSIVKDVIFNSKPKYSSISLYPIESSVAPLNRSGDVIALATLMPTVSPSLMYYRNKPVIREGGIPAFDICDYIEDYRSGTILDVVGSVGGLFALLQAAHMLLFGRPLFWGLVGAKTISPFGLLGQCSSRGFKRRLREEYHIQSTEEGTGTIHIVKFLRDFVIDFGPANLDPESHALQQSESLSPRVETHKESATGAQMQVPVAVLIPGTNQ
ncbi:hypothetical protein RHS04_07798 [Rhizoctonia solani]|uniref:Kex protein n=1 Tax=Rhizoctonia solani TaxID=456999 RepID=A0A8H7LEQ5_9AGAM|nr:hypothetical protein RHS04_07798 [Rhizoctonia solani]